MKTIENIADIQNLVDSFYDLVRQDELLAPIFNPIIQNWAEHLPRMYDFWSTMLLGTMTYKGDPFGKHISLPIEEKHFERWVKLFCQTIDNQFVGEKAEEAKQRARSIAQVFQHKILTLRKLDSN